MSPLRVRYQTIEFGAIDIHIRSLRDNQQFHDPLFIAEKLGISSASWPLFGVIWPSSIALANYVLNYDTRNIRILEIGCGIGLASLLLNKLKADITATDYHPEAESFLLENATLNNGKSINFERTDWNNSDSTLGNFDLIIGSDLLYEDEHIDLLSKFIEQHAKPGCEVLIADPDRGRKSKFTKQMSHYGYSYTHTKPETANNLDDSYKGHILRFLR